MHRYNSIIISILLMLIFTFPKISQAFLVQSDYSYYESTGFFLGIWHGLLAPWSLITRWFISDIGMYSINNTGWFYDGGFLLGVGGSLPIGWLAAIISTIGHLFFY